MPRIASCSIAPCPHRYRQSELRDAVLAHFKDRIDGGRYGRVFTETRIEQRSFVAPVERLVLSREGWLARNALFIEEGTRLGRQALAEALELAGLAPADLGHLFFISTTGIAAPSLDARILGRPPWDPGTLRTPIWGLGCAGGISGLRCAADWVAAHPGKAAAVLCVEFCSLTFLPGDYSVANFVAAALFADGVGCAVVAGDRLAEERGIAGLRIAGRRVRLFHDSLDVMGWSPVEQGLQVVFSRRIPAIVLEHARGEFDALVNGAGIDPRSVTRFLGHPGGPKVLEAYARALDWPQERFDTAWSVLADWGNLSSASILYVLHAALRDTRAGLGPQEHALLAALGPGFTSEQILAAPAD